MSGPGWKGPNAAGQGLKRRQRTGGRDGIARANSTAQIQRRHPHLVHERAHDVCFFEQAGRRVGRPRPLLMLPFFEKRGQTVAQRRVNNRDFVFVQHNIERVRHRSALTPSFWKQLARVSTGNAEIPMPSIQPKVRMSAKFLPLIVIACLMPVFQIFPAIKDDVRFNPLPAK